MVLTTTRNDRSLVNKAEKTTLKHKRRFCKVEGCSRIVKSQGVCQRHGAKPRKCRIVDCPKQAQGNYDGMCKAHFRAHKNNALSMKEEEQQTQRTASTMTFCQPVVVPSVVTEESSTRQGPEGEESTIVSHSATTDEGRDLWDEPYFCSNGTRSEELAADLFGVLSEVSPSMTCEEWSGGQMTRKQDRMSVENRVHSVPSIPSCSDYSPNYYSSNYYGVDHRDANNYMPSSSLSSSPYMDYYFHEKASSREAV